MILQKWLTIFGSSLYGGVILMVTTDFFLEDSLVLGWVWERVKVNNQWCWWPSWWSQLVTSQVDRMVEEGLGAVETLPRCWMAWAVTAIWPVIFLTGSYPTSDQILLVMFWRRKKNSCTIYCSSKNANLERRAYFSFFWGISYIHFGHFSILLSTKIPLMETLLRAINDKLFAFCVKQVPSNWQ